MRWTPRKKLGVFPYPWNSSLGATQWPQGNEPLVRGSASHRSGIHARVSRAGDAAGTAGNSRAEHGRMSWLGNALVRVTCARST